MNIFRRGKEAVDTVFLVIGFLISLVVGTLFISWLGAINSIVFGSLIIAISIMVAAKILKSN